MSDQTYETLRERFRTARYIELTLSERLSAEALFLAMPNLCSEIFSRDILVNLLERCRKLDPID